MYWSPKMHKKVIGNRIIIASKVSSLKPLAEDITKTFSGLLIIMLMCQVRWIASVRKVMPAVFPHSISQHSIPKSPTINFCNVFNFSLIWFLMIRTESSFLVPILEPTGFLVHDMLTEGTLRTQCHLHLSF